MRKTRLKLQNVLLKTKAKLDIMAKNHKIAYQKEFFDRDYTVREAYGRI
jgi:hypothetical protein